MAFVMIRIEVPNLTVDQLNSKLNIDSTNPHEGVQQVLNLVTGVTGGLLSAEIDLAVRNTTQTITAAGGGDSGSYNLL